MPLVYIVLVNYNTYRETIECVNSLKKIQYRRYKIIIVENGSNNNSIEELKKEANDCIIIESKKNLGFAGANNLAIKYSVQQNADYVLLLNNDTLVEKDFLNKMLKSIQNENNVGIVGSKIKYYADKSKIWFGGGEIDWFKFIGVNLEMRNYDNGQCDVEKEIDFMTGCCMLIKKDVFIKCGLLSEEYFMYFEDVDFCVKVREEGYKIIYNPKAVIYHKVGLSGGGEESPFALKWCTRNRLFFMNKYSYKVNKISFILSKCYFYCTRGVRYIQYILKGEINKAKAISNGIKDALIINNKGEIHEKIKAK